jgi:hypothetical protein
MELYAIAALSGVVLLLVAMVVVSIVLMARVAAVNKRLKRRARKLSDDIDDVYTAIEDVEDKQKHLPQQMTTLQSSVKTVDAALQNVQIKVASIPDDVAAQLQTSGAGNKLGRLCVGGTCFYEPEVAYMKKTYASVTTVSVPVGTWNNAGSTLNPQLVIAPTAALSGWTLSLKVAGSTTAVPYAVVPDSMTASTFNLYDITTGKKHAATITFVTGATTLTFSGETANAGVYTKAAAAVTTAAAGTTTAGTTTAGTTTV